MNKPHVNIQEKAQEGKNGMVETTYTITKSKNIMHGGLRTTMQFLIIIK